MGDKIQEQIQQFYAEVGDSPAMQPVKDAITTIMDRMIVEGMSPKQAINISDDTMEGFYTEGQRLYSSGKYEDALRMFRFLTLLDPTRIRYILGMAACQHMRGKYIGAAQLYQMCGLADPTDPIPHFHMADCYLKLDMIAVAVHCLKTTVRYCGGEPKYAKIRDRAKMMIKELSQREAKKSKEAA